MNIKQVQRDVADRGKKLGIKKQKPLEILAAITEELGEVATEVSLFEQIGNKVNWKRKADKKLLEREIAQLLINVVGLASVYKIDVEEALTRLFESK